MDNEDRAVPTVHKGLAPRFQACDGHGACVILDRPETQPRGPIACRPASAPPGRASSPNMDNEDTRVPTVHIEIGGPMIDDTQLEHWKTKAEASEILKCSEKTISRLAAQK